MNTPDYSLFILAAVIVLVYIPWTVCRAESGWSKTIKFSGAFHSLNSALERVHEVEIEKQGPDQFHGSVSRVFQEIKLNFLNNRFVFS